MPEDLILVDDDDREIGCGEKIEVHRKGLLHRAFSVIVWDGEGRQLLQQRAAGKYHSAGLWTNACCGHPRPGEGIAAAARRRLGEEMGFTCELLPLGSLVYRAELDNGLIEHERVHILRGTYGGPLTPAPDEVQACAWLQLSEIEHRIGASPDQFTAWFKLYAGAGWPMAKAEGSSRQTR